MSDLTGKSVYALWNALNKGLEGATLFATAYPSVREDGQGGQEDPQPGLWRIKVNKRYEDGKLVPPIYAPMQIWLADESGTVVHKWQPGLTIAGTINHQPVDGRRIIDRWMGAKPITKAANLFHKDTGKWPDEAEAIQVAGETAVAKQAEIERIARETAPPPISAKLEPVPEPTTSAVGSIPGHNSGETDSFTEMKSESRALVVFRNARVELVADIAEAQAYYAKKPIAVKLDADKCENWRKRIAAAGKQADKLRREEKKPIELLLEEIDARWNPLIRDAKTQSDAMQAITDAWVKAEQKRLNDEAAANAKAQLDKQREATRLANEAAAEQHRKEQAERDLLMKKDPIAALTSPEIEKPKPAPLPPVPEKLFVAPVAKVMIGTAGARRSVKEAPATASITDLAKAVMHLVSVNDPELIKLVQKRADSAAKARSTFPGVFMSFQAQQAAE
jgi:hypothetical protein